MIDLKTIQSHPNPYRDDVVEYYKAERRARFYRPAGYNHKTFARSVETKIAQQIALLGYSVRPTRPNARFDLWAGGAKVEVKGSRWNDDRHRYQAAVRNYEADVLIFDAVNGTDHLFVIPMTMVIPKKTIEICSYDVARYAGQWAAFLEAWNWLHQIIEQAPKLPVQLELGLCLDTITLSTT